VALVLFVALALVLPARPAAAHTGFESSDPADGTTVSAPLEEVTVRFTGPAEPSGDGFVVLDGDGVERRPEPVGSEDGTVWVLRFDQALGSGTVGVRWMVQAPDAHPIDGSFSFVVDAGPVDPPTVEEVLPSAPTTSVAPTEGSLDEFLSGTGSASVDTGERIATVGRAIGIAATLVGVGALVFAAFVLRAGAGDVRHVVFWVRRAGALVVLGAVVRLVGRSLIDSGGSWTSATSPGAVVDTLGTSTGLAIALRAAGGVLLVVGCRVGLRDASGGRDPLVRGRELVAAGVARARGAEPSADTAHHRPAPGAVSWTARGGALAWVGAALLLAGYLFDGHTVTEGPRLVTALTDVVHVAAASVWVGGIAMLVSVLRRRHRRGEELGALHLAARFSIAATVALLGVAVSGALLALVVLDQPSQLWSSPWGRTLSAKIAFVAVAAALGGYNHRYLIPRMEAEDAKDPQHGHRLRTVASVEALVLAAVVVLTAVLVGAAT